MKNPIKNGISSKKKTDNPLLPQMESHGMDLDMLGSAVASSGMTVSERFVGERNFYNSIFHRHPHSIVLVHLQKNCCTRSPSLFATGWPILVIWTIWPFTWSYMQKCYIGSSSLQEAGLFKWSRSYMQTIVVLNRPLCYILIGWIIRMIHIAWKIICSIMDVPLWRGQTIKAIRLFCKQIAILDHTLCNELYYPNDLD